MRAWVHEIWWEQNITYVLHTLPRDEKQIEALIQQYGERRVAVAWQLYVREEPPMYNLDGVTKTRMKDWWKDKTHYSGPEEIVVETDAAKVTRFPLAAFLKISQCYLDRAQGEMAYYSDPECRPAEEKVDILDNNRTSWDRIANLPTK